MPVDAGKLTVVSAPGKVLVAGGYLVLDRDYSGLVVATSSRFYTSVQSIASGSTPPESETTRLTVRAGQFPREESTWAYEVGIGDGAIELHPAPGAQTKNKFVETTLKSVLHYALAWHIDKRGKEGLDTVRRHLAGQGCGLEVVVLADNDFYSQRTTLASLGLPAKISSLPYLPPFSKLPQPIHKTNKTGLGSSAALVTSLTAAVLSHLGVVEIPSAASSSSTSKTGLDVVHSVAQFAHCLAQGKVGSGFDVSSAVYGSHSYRRFSPSILTPLLGSSDAPDSLLSALNPTGWDQEIKPFSLPRGLRLLLADVDAGTDTPSFVGKVLSWRKEKTEEADKLWTSLHAANGQLRWLLEELVAQEGNDGYERELAHLATGRIGDGSMASPSGVEDSLSRTQASLFRIRQHMREISEASGVPIEPPEQTRLLDACSACPGVVGGGVPGAGGYDALFLLVIDQPGVIASVEEVWSSWTEMSVCPLSAKQSDGGLRLEKVDEVRGLEEALRR